MAVTETITEPPAPQEAKMTTEKGIPSATLDFPFSKGLVAAHFFGLFFIALIVQAAVNFKDITGALAFYGVYHREPLNQVIHFFGVPGILFSFLIYLAHFKMPYLDKMVNGQDNKNPHHVTYATLLCSIYTVFFLKIDPFGGTLYLPVIYAMYTSSIALVNRDQFAAASASNGAGAPWYGTKKLMAFAFALHVFSWYIQIHPGHKIIEGAQPAVMQSVGGALTVAPLFAFYEGLWFVGINRGLQEQTLTLVAQYTRELCEAGVEMRACASI